MCTNIRGSGAVAHPTTAVSSVPAQVQHHILKENHIERVPLLTSLSYGWTGPLTIFRSKPLQPLLQTTALESASNVTLVFSK
jgi:hypothetical protein